MSDTKKSATEQLIDETQRDMLDTFARLLSTPYGPEIARLTTKLDRLAHERALAIKFECARRTIELLPANYSFVVVDGVLRRSTELPGGGADNG